MTYRLLMTAVFAIGLASTALAHALLEDVDPSAGSQLKASPRSVTLTFSASVEPRFSAIEVRDGQGNRMDTGSVYRGGARTIAVNLLPVAPGLYTVIWRAISVDTHKTEGHFDFTVRR